MQPDKIQPDQRFDVQVGFARITVSSNSPAEAIAEARRQLSRESPRLWDVIFGLADSRFVVCPID